MIMPYNTDNAKLKEMKAQQKLLEGKLSEAEKGRAAAVEEAEEAAALLLEVYRI